MDLELERKMQNGNKLYTMLIKRICFRNRARNRAKNRSKNRAISVNKIQSLNTVQKEQKWPWMG